MISKGYILIGLLLISTLVYYLGKKRAFAVAGGYKGLKDLHSRPHYYGALAALWCLIPACIIFGAWAMFEDTIITNLVLSEMPQAVQELPADQLGLKINDVRNLAQGNIVSSGADAATLKAAEHYNSLRNIGNTALALLVLCLGLAGSAMVYKRIAPAFRARNRVERVISILLVFCSTIAIFTTIGIVLSVLYEAIRFFQQIPITDFIFGLDWSPQMAIREDQVGSSGAFGAIPVFAGTALISLIAMCVAVPIGLFSAVYLSEYANSKLRALAKPLMEILAGIPTVVYGFFAALTVAPMIRESGSFLGLDVASESALAAGVVMGVMIIPFVSSISDDVINAVPQSLRDGAYGLGATKSETVKQVILPAALPGIVGGVMLAVSRAIGETMIVVMAAGLSANLTANPLQAVTTVTVQIVTLLVGDQEFDSPKTLAAFALGLVLFLVTLTLNVIALRVVRKYREQYE
jgi:phosphate transport system permease protein